jgi:hypothetical protein
MDRLPEHVLDSLREANDGDFATEDELREALGR